MNANELRIGNYVFDDEDQIVKVENIMSKRFVAWNEMEECVLFSKSDDPVNMFSSKIYPIPLTYEMLVRLGFSKDEYKNGYIGKDFKSGQMTLDFVLSEPLTKGQWNIYYTFDLLNSRFKSLEYVHQLQNLYFDLTGEELALS